VTTMPNAGSGHRSRQAPFSQRGTSESGEGSGMRAPEAYRGQCSPVAPGSLLPARNERIGRRVGDEGSGSLSRAVVTGSRQAPFSQRGTSESGEGSGMRAPEAYRGTWSPVAPGSLLRARNERIGRRVGDEGSGILSRDVVTVCARLPSPSEVRANREMGRG